MDLRIPIPLWQLTSYVHQAHLCLQRLSLPSFCLSITRVSALVLHLQTLFHLWMQFICITDKVSLAYYPKIMDNNIKLFYLRFSYACNAFDLWKSFFLYNYVFHMGFTSLLHALRLSPSDRTAERNHTFKFLPLLNTLPNLPSYVRQKQIPKGFNKLAPSVIKMQNNGEM